MKHKYMLTHIHTHLTHVVHEKAFNLHHVCTGNKQVYLKGSQKDTSEMRRRLTERIMAQGQQKVCLRTYVYVYIYIYCVCVCVCVCVCERERGRRVRWIFGRSLVLQSVPV